MVNLGIIVTHNLKFGTEIDHKRNSELSRK